MKNFLLVAFLASVLNTMGQNNVTTYYNEITKSNKKEVYQTNSRGTKNGSYKKFFEDGKLMESCTYVNGKVNGLRELFWELREENYKTEVFACGGQALRQEYWENGIEIGTWKTWTCKAGARKLKQVKKYKNGKLNYELEYWTNGKKYIESNYPNGTYTSWYENGNIEESYDYVDGKKSGNYILNYPNGKVHLKFKVSNNKIVNSVQEYYNNGQMKTDFKLSPNDLNEDLIAVIKRNRADWSNDNGYYGLVTTYKKNGEKNTEYKAIIPSTRAVVNNADIPFEDKIVLVSGILPLENGNMLEVNYVKNPKSGVAYLKEKTEKNIMGEVVTKYVQDLKQNQYLSYESYYKDGSLYFKENSDGDKLYLNPKGDTILTSCPGLDAYEGWYNLPKREIAFFSFVGGEIPNGIQMFDDYAEYDSLSVHYDGYVVFSRVKNVSTFKLMTFDGEYMDKFTISDNRAKKLFYFSKYNMKIVVKGKDLYLRRVNSKYEEIKPSSFKSEEKYQKYIDKLNKKRLK